MSGVIFFARREEFADWLEANTDASELWVGYYKKGSGKTGLSWSETVDVALCYGWIDGVRNTIDDHSYKNRFTPRKKGSVWSAVNVKKVNALVQSGQMKPAGLQMFNSRADTKGYSAEDRNIPLAQEYEDLIRSIPCAWSYFYGLAPSYKRDSIWWVMSAKREETRLRRLSILITSSEEGQKIPLLRKK
ncbi:YdeI/OmpD-associated family protein [Porticoccaceae bacterium]|nr:YdeI/OmpD-associated family protein [Porticoccaceae bacterium]